jgi:triosephosphate isomerase (TIM)
VNRPLIGTSWKMNLTPTEAGRWFAAATPGLASLDDRDLFVLPPFPAIAAARDALLGTRVAWGAQDVHAADHGAHTGDVSAPMLADLGCRFVEVGHSERRRDHREGDRLLAAKVAAIRRWHMTPILCVGERTRRSVEAATHAVTRQLRGTLGSLDSDALDAVVLAYEPVWAIGVGAAAAPLDHIEAMHAAIRRWLARRGARSTRVIYGGSVDVTNAEPIVRLDHVDGLFVGRAALDPHAFVRIAGVEVGERRDRWDRIASAS